MRLVVTGAVLRAARSARLGTTATPSASHTPTTTSTVLAHSRPRRWASNQSQSPFSSPFFPEQSVDASSEVDPQKTEEESIKPEHSPARVKFLEQLKNHPEDKQIIQDPEDKDISGTKIFGQPFVFDQTSNVSPSILSLVGRNLYNIPNHPLCITRKLIESSFPYPTYKNHVATNPVVTVKDNFDVLGFPQNHPGRSRTDTYYVDSTRLLRTHTSAHQHAAFQYMAEHPPEKGYTICADVYRRDSIDRSHFPVFHQMEGARLWELPPKKDRQTELERLRKRIVQVYADFKSLPQHGLKITDEAGPYKNDTNPVQVNHDPHEIEVMGAHLKRSLELLVARVFTAAKEAGVGNPDSQSDTIQVRWIEAYFPFTSPSWELEVWWQGEWLELLGCGITTQSIIDNAGLPDRTGWAWGIGIERLAMLLFGIPDIRLFWSQDPRFLNQFSEGKITKFEPFSKYPACYKDVAFWIPSSPAGGSPIGANISDKPHPGVAAASGGNALKASPTETQPAAFHENDLMEIVRDLAGELVEDVKMLEEFIHPTSGRKSLCYRINYRSLEKTLKNSDVNVLHKKICSEMQERLGVELR